MKEQTQQPAMLPGESSPDACPAGVPRPPLGAAAGAPVCTCGSGRAALSACPWWPPASRAAGQRAVLDKATINILASSRAATRDICRQF